MSLALVGAAVAAGAPPAAADHSAWSQYVLGPASDDVAPVRSSVLSGDVRHAKGVHGKGDGTTTLSVPTGGAPATVLLDYGVEMVGAPAIEVLSATPGAQLHLAFSETRQHLLDSSGHPVGDGVGTGGYPRTQTLAVTAGSTSTGTFEGGFRFQTITLDAPGTVVLRGAHVHFQAYRATPAQYQGNFAASSRSLTSMWYSGAYTRQTDMQPQGIQRGLAPSVLDGAKRDRKIWSGDIAIEGRGILDSFGSNGAAYVKQSLLALMTLSTPGHGLAGFGDPAGGSTGLDPAYSNAYSSWTVDDAFEYYQATGDTAFIRQVLPYLEGQLSYDATLADANGLLVTAARFGGQDCGLDWDIYDGPQGGESTRANLLYYRILTDVASVEDQLGDAVKAEAYRARATALKDAINTHLYDPTTGAYDISDTTRGPIAQDANSLALLFGVSPAQRVPGVVAALKTLWGPRGSAPFSADAQRNPLISPFVSGLEVEGLYRAGYAADAEKLLALTWGQMIDRQNPNYTGTFWENYLPDGTLQDGSISAAHGWAAAPTTAMTRYVLGVQPVDAGYRTFTVTPRFGDLRWASGTVPTPYGPITVEWRQRHADQAVLLVRAPRGTTARVTAPSGTRVTVTVAS